MSVSGPSPPSAGGLGQGDGQASLQEPALWVCHHGNPRAGPEVHQGAERDRAKGQEDLCQSSKSRKWQWCASMDPFLHYIIGGQK